MLMPSKRGKKRKLFLKKLDIGQTNEKNLESESYSTPAKRNFSSKGNPKTKLVKAKQKCFEEIWQHVNFFQCSNCKKKKYITHVVLHTVALLHNLHNSVVGIGFADDSSKNKMKITMRATE